MVFENGFEGGKWQEKVGGVCLLPDRDGHPLGAAQGESKDTEAYQGQRARGPGTLGQLVSESCLW